MNVMDIVKSRLGTCQIISDGQDHGKYAKLDLNAPMTVKLKDGRQERLTLNDLTDTSIAEKFAFQHDNPHLL